MFRFKFTPLTLNWNLHSGLLSHFNQFGSHASRASFSHQNVTEVMAILKKNKDRNKNIYPRFWEILLYQPKKGWCHGHFWHLLKSKIQQACHGSQGLLNWLKWDSMFNGLAEFYFEHYVWFTGRFKHCSWGPESDHV